MSKQVDERVVSMQFDNAQFERNVSTTMSTLDKLKQKLHLDGAVKGLENVGAATKNINMNGLGNAVEQVSMKFSAMQVMGVTALTNITNQAVNAGKRMLSALTVDPVKTGFSEYEMKLDSIKTIVASTGEELPTVNKYLEELNEYSDQTIYSFADMTQNIGKFTNAGVKLEDAVMAIKGISNEAAVSGANANEASRAMYNFAQALSAGYVKLIDWKSIENANMATVEFKDQLISTALEMGTVTKTADGLYQTLEGNTFNATKNFNEVLQDQWMTSEVLVETLKRYADETTDIGKKAKAAAQDVTKFTQLFDILKESAQSGWAKTWELIIGDLDEAKKTLTKISNFLTGVINRMSDFRNNIVEGVMDFATPWARITEKLDKAGLGGLTEIVEKVSEATDKLEYFQDIVNRVWRGDFDVAPNRYQLLEEAGYDHRVVQDLVNKGYQYKITVEDIEASHKKFGLTMETTTENTEKVTSSFQSLTDEQLRNAKLTEDEIKLYRDLEKEAGRLGISVDDLIKRMSEKDGRTLLIDSLANASNGLVGIFTALKDAWFEIFPAPSIARIYTALDAINKFSERLRLLKVNTKTGEFEGLNETGKKLLRTFKGVFAILDVVTTLVGGGLKIAFKVIAAILSYFNYDVLDLTASIGDNLVAFRDWVDSVLDIEGAIHSLLDWGKGLIANMLEQNNSFERTRNAAKAFVESINAIKEAISGWLSGAKEAENIPKYILEGLVNGIKNGGPLVIQVFKDLGRLIIEAFEDVLDMHSPSVVFFVLGGFIIAGLVRGLIDGKHTLLKTMIEIGKSIIGSFDGAIEGLRSKLQNGDTSFFGIIKSAGMKVVDFLKSIDWGAIFAAGTIIGFLFIGFKIVKTLENISDALGGFGELMQSASKALKSFSTLLNAKAMQSIAIAIAILAASLIALSFVPWQKLAVGCGAIIVLAVTLSLLTKSIATLGDTNIKGFTKFAIIMGGIGATMILLAIALAQISKLSEDDIKQCSRVILGLSGVVISLMAATRLVGSNKQLDTIGITLMKIAGAIMILGFVVKFMSGLRAYDAEKGIMAVAGLGAIIVGLMAATKLCGTRNMAKLGNAMIGIGIAFVLLAKTLEIMSGISEEDMQKGVKVVAAFGVIVAGLIAATKLAGRKSAIGKTLLSISASMFILVAVIKLIGTVDNETLVRGYAVVTALSALIVGLVAATKLSKSGLKGVPSTLLVMSVSIGILAGVSALMGLVRVESLVKGITAVSVLCGMMSLMVSSLKGAKSVTGTMIAMTVMVGVLVASVTLLSILAAKNPEKLIAAVFAVSALMSALSMMIASTKYAKVKKGFAKTLFTMGGVIAILSGIVLALSFMPNPDKAFKNAVSVSMLLMALTTSLVILSSVKKPNKGVLTALYSLSGVVAILGTILGLMSFLDVSGSIVNAVSLGLLLNEMAACMLILNYVKKPHKGVLTALYSLSGVVAILGTILGLMSFFNIEASITNTVALGLLLNEIAASMLILNYVKKPHKGVLTALYSLSGVVAILGTIMGLMNVLNAEASIPNAIALGLLLNEMAACMLILNFVKKPKEGAIASLYILSGVVAILAVIMGTMSAFDVEASITSAIALGLLLNEMAASMLILDRLKAPKAVAIGAFYILSGVVAILAVIMGTMAVLNAEASTSNAWALGSLIKALATSVKTLSMMAFVSVGTLMKGLLAMTLMVVPLTGIALVLAGMSRVQNSISNAVALTVLATSLSLLLIPLTLVGALCMTGAPFLGVLALTTMIVPLAGLVLILSEMAKIKNAETNTILLISLMGALTNMLVSVSLVSPLLVIAVGAITALIAVIGLTGLLVTAVGYLLTKHPELQTYITAGIPLMIKLAEGIGKMVGAFVANVMTTVANSLPGIGESLSLFMENVSGFVEGVKSVDTDVLAGAANLTGAILCICAADFISGVTSGILGPLSLPLLGEELSCFWNNAKDFIEGARGVKESDVAGVKAMAAAIMVLTAADFIDGLNRWNPVNWGTTKSPLETFGEEIGKLGGGFRVFALNMAEVSEEDLNKANIAAGAIETIAKASEKIPNSGGWLGKIVGNNDLGTFAQQFGTLGSGVRSFLDNLTVNGTQKFESAQAEIVSRAADSLITICDAANAIPNSGGLLGEIMGNNDLGGFSEQLPKLGSGLRGFIISLTMGDYRGQKMSFGGEEKTLVENAASALTTLATAAKDIPNSGGILGDIIGNNDLGGFSTQLPKLGSGLRGFLNALTADGTTFGETELLAIQNGSNALKTFATIAKDIPNEGGLWGKIVGDNALGNFSDQLPLVGTGLSGFVKNLGTFGDDQVATVTAAAKAITAMAALADTSLEKLASLPILGQEIPSIGAAISKFTANMCGIQGGSRSVDTAVNSAKKVIELIRSCDGKMSLKYLASDLRKGIEELGEAGVSEFVNAFVGNEAIENITNAGKTMVDKLIAGVEDKTEALKGAMRSLITTLKDTITAKNQKEKMLKAGRFIADGLAEGIADHAYKASDELVKTVNDAIDDAKEAAQVRSPSRKTYEIGRYMAFGLINALRDYSEKASKAGGELAKSSVSGMQDTIGMIGTILDSDLDIQPTISPVVDLSNVRAGTNAINDMLALGSAIGMTTSISNSMGRRQNGVNSEIASALDKLNKNLGRVGDSYNINGVSYTENSDVAEAIKTIVRAARIERRV